MPFRQPLVRSAMLACVSACARALSDELNGPAACSVRRLHCQSPSDEYAILGSEDRVGACAPQENSDGVWFFEFTVGEPGVGECNATIDIGEDGSEKYTATLVHAPEEHALLLGDYPTLVCSCEVHMEGSAHTGLHQSVTSEEVAVGGVATFEPMALAYASDAFLQLLPTDSGSAEVSSEHFYLKIRSPQDTDNVNVTSCLASPADEDYRESFEVPVWVACELDGAFERQVYPTENAYEVLLSMRAFKFQGLGAGVLLTCAAIRCAEAPCHTCDAGGGGRLLHSQDGEDGGAVTIQLFTGAQSNPIVLPGPLDEVTFTPLHSARGAASPAVRGSVVFYNSPVFSDDGFPASLAEALKAWLGLEDLEVIVTEVAVAGDDGERRRLRRRLQDSGGAPETAQVLVKFEAVPASEEDLDAALARIETAIADGSEQALVKAWREELLKTWAVEAPSLIAQKVDAPSDYDSLDISPTGAPTLAPEAPASSSSDDPVDTISFEQPVTTIVAVLSACLVCCGFIHFWRCARSWHGKSSLRIAADSQYRAQQEDELFGVTPSSRE